MRPTPPRWLDGPPLRLPSLLDRAAERWWHARPRARAALIVALVSLLLLVGVARVLAGPYGPPETVVVATRDLAVGRRLEPGDVRAARWPRNLLPGGALRGTTASPGSMVGTTLAAPLPAGAIVTGLHLATGGLAAMLPTGTVAVGVPTDALPDLAAGTLLDVVGRDLDGRPVPLASHARVVAVDPTTLWLAVRPEDGPPVAAAAGARTLAVVLRPG